MTTTAANTPGYNARLGIWFTTTRKGQRIAQYYSWAAQRAIRVPVADAEIWIANELADQTSSHPFAALRNS